MVFGFPPGVINGDIRHSSDDEWTAQSDALLTEHLATRTPPHSPRLSMSKAGTKISAPSLSEAGETSEDLPASPTTPRVTKPVPFQAALLPTKSRSFDTAGTTETRAPSLRIGGCSYDSSPTSPRGLLTIVPSAMGGTDAALESQSLSKFIAALAPTPTKDPLSKLHVVKNVGEIASEDLEGSSADGVRGDGEGGEKRPHDSDDGSSPGEDAVSHKRARMMLKGSRGGSKGHR